MSGLPPGEVPTRMRNGRLGQSDCARAGKAPAMAAEAAKPSVWRRVNGMAAPSLAQPLTGRPILAHFWDWGGWSE